MDGVEDFIPTIWKRCNVKIVKFKYINKPKKEKNECYGICKGLIFKKFYNFCNKNWESRGVEGLDSGCYTWRTNVIAWHEELLYKENSHKITKVDIKKLKEEEDELVLIDRLDNLVE